MLVTVMAGTGFGLNGKKQQTRGSKNSFRHRDSVNLPKSPAQEKKKHQKCQHVDERRL
jgi:hypothetical protein